MDYETCIQHFTWQTGCQVLAYPHSEFLHADFYSKREVKLENNHTVMFTFGNGDEVGLNSVNVRCESGNDKPTCQKEIRSALEVLKDEWPLKLIAYRAAASDTELVQPIGSVIAEGPFFRDIFFGRAIGVRRNIAIRAEDCAATLQNDKCIVRIIPHDHPDHPAAAYGETVKKTYTFSTGSTVDIVTGANDETYEITYRKSPSENPSVGTLVRIAEAIQALKGTQADLYLDVMMFTPDDPQKQMTPPYLSGRIVDTKIGDATYNEEKRIALKFEDCSKNYNPAIATCTVRDSEIENIEQPKPLIRHPYEWETKRIQFNDKSIVAFEPYDWFPFFYQTKFLPGSPSIPLSQGLDYIRRAYEKLDTTSEASLNACSIKVY